jgi:tetratricopeptide (TPR) repeat protein/predicted aspartyl protease
MGWKSAFLAIGFVGATFTVADPAFAECKLGKLAELPVTMRGLSPLVSAKINGGSVTLIADSGAFFSLLTPGAASRLGLRGGPLPLGMSITGATGDAQMTYATVKEFSAPGMEFKNGVDFLIGASGTETTSDGLLGANFLSQVDAEYDLAHGAIRLMHPEGCGKTDLAYWANNIAVGVVPIEEIALPDSKIKGVATINGVKLKVIFDTGASISELTLAGAKRAGVTPQDNGVIAVEKEHGVGREVVTRYIAPIKTFEIGGEAIKNTKLSVADIHLDDVDMLIGADFFLSHHIYVARSQNKLYFTYNGGPVFNLTGQPQSIAGGASQGPEPTDAAGYARQAAALLSRGDVKAALTSYDKAVQLAPTDPDLLYERALAERETGEPKLAVADLDKVISLRPSKTAALLARGDARLANKNVDGARQDFNQAIKADIGLRLRVAQAYESNEMFAEAIDEYSQIIAHPATSTLPVADTGSYVARRADDPHVSDALVGRCHARAMTGQNLKDALDDCNRGSRLTPGATDVIVDRAYVQFRLGQFDQALSDFTVALRDQPRDAWALYGKGLAELRKGQADKGQVDLKAAEALQPMVAKRAQTFGLTP